jgi:hypothetical protein
MGMRFRAPVVVTLVAVLALAAACGDDDSSDETQAGDSRTTSSSSASSTSEPAQGGGSLPDRPAELTGEVTDSEGGRLLVEEQPDAPDSGRKAWVAIEGPVLEAASGGDPSPAEASDIEQGEQVEVWTGICAQSYPEQCAAEALLIR